MVDAGRAGGEPLDAAAQLLTRVTNEVVYARGRGDGRVALRLIDELTAAADAMIAAHAAADRTTPPVPERRPS
jgi:hypothetical protein